MDRIKYRRSDCFVQIGAMIELCWGVRILQSPNADISVVLSDSPFGAYIATFLILFSLLKLALYRLDIESSIMSLISIFNFALFAAAVASVQSLDSSMFFLNLFFLFMQGKTLSNQMTNKILIKEGAHTWSNYLQRCSRQ